MRAVKLSGSGNVQDYSGTSSAEYHGAGTGDFHAGHRNHDDGTGGAEFSGTGAKPPVPEWGSMMSDTRSLMTISPWITFHRESRFFFCYDFNLLGDTIRDYADPKSWEETNGGTFIKIRSGGYILPGRVGGKAGKLCGRSGRNTREL